MGMDTVIVYEKSRNYEGAILMFLGGWHVEWWQIRGLEESTVSRPVKPRRQIEYRDRQIAEGGIDVHQLYERARLAVAHGLTGRRKDKRGARIQLEVRVLAPAAVLAQFPAVVAPHNHDRLLAQAQPVQFVQQAADLSG